jgi:hypothetical protein
VISRGIAVVFVFAVYLMIPETRDYRAMNNWMAVNGEMARTLTLVVLT